MPVAGPSSDDRGRRRRSRSQSRSDSPLRRAPQPASPDMSEASFEIAEGVPKGGTPTWRAEVSIPRPANGRFANNKPSFITIRGPSRVSKRDSEDEGDKMVDVARKDGMEG